MVWFNLVPSCARQYFHEVSITTYKYQKTFKIVENFFYQYVWTKVSNFFRIFLIK